MIPQINVVYMHGPNIEWRGIIGEGFDEGVVLAVIKNEMSTFRFTILTCCVKWYKLCQFVCGLWLLS